MPDTPFGQFKPVSRPGIHELDVSEMLRTQLPAFQEATTAVTYEQLALVGQVASDAGTHESIRLLFNLAVNDFRDLVGDLDMGSGRSAMRAARAVIEHAINLHTVVDSLKEASRYLEHLDQGSAIAVNLATGANRLDARTRSSYLHALRKRGTAAARRFEAAVDEHGSWFQRGWTQGTAKDRADRFGLENLYDYYRLASLVTHGSAGGSLGSVRDHPDGYRIYRTGAALELAPVAMWAGIRGHREVLTALQRVRPDIDIDAYTSALDEFDHLWADYFEALTQIDKELWPTERVQPPVAVLAFSQATTRRWYLHLPMTACLIQAKEPDLPDWMEERVTGLIDKMIAEQPYLFRPDQYWITVAIAGVTVTPVDDARAIPDSALFEFLPDDWEPSDAHTIGDGDL